MLDGFSEVVRTIRVELAKDAARRITEAQANSREQYLRKKFADARDARIRLAQEQKAEKKQDLITRGLANSTVVDALHRKIDNDCVADVKRMNDELTSAIECIWFQAARSPSTIWRAICLFFRPEHKKLGGRQ